MWSTSARPPGIARLIWPYLRPQAGRLLLALLVGLLIAALAAAQPLLTRIIIDQGLIGRRFDVLLDACLGMLALAICGLALGAVHRVLYVRASGRALFALRGAAYAHLLRVSPRRLAEIPVGDLTTRLDGDVAEVQRFGTDSAATVLSNLLGNRRRGHRHAQAFLAADAARGGAAAAAAHGAPLRAPAHRGQHARACAAKPAGSAVS